MAAMNMKNSAQVTTHPCLTPVSILKGSVSTPLPLSALADILSCNSLGRNCLPIPVYFKSGNW